MKTEISKNKIKQIIKSYIKENKTSNIILEQDSNLKSRLKALENCFNETLTPTTTNMSGKGDEAWAIRCTSPTTKAVRYFFINGKIAQKSGINDGLSYLPDASWNPDNCSPSQKSNSYTHGQLTRIDIWKNKGAKLKNDLEGEDQTTYKPKLVSPKSEGLFEDKDFEDGPEGRGFYMWVPPANLNAMKSNNSKSAADITKTFTDLVNKHTPDNNKDCKNAVRTFYESYKYRLPIPASEMAILQPKVKACRTRFYQNWGALQGGNNLDKMLEVLAQVRYDSPWFVTAVLDDKIN